MKLFDLKSSTTVIRSNFRPVTSSKMLKDTGTTRKLDSYSRITIPIDIREKYGFRVGCEYPFFIYEDEKGSSYICIKAPSISEEQVREAEELLARYKKSLSN